MPPSVSDIVEATRQSARSLVDYGSHLFNPTIRLGVTGLARSGKTVFITALIHGLLRGGRFPVFEAYAGGRIARVRLAPQPDDAIPRFNYEEHLKKLVELRDWPTSTTDLAQLRLVIDYQRKTGAERTLTIDLVDYPGEWLLDLPLLGKSYEEWAAESLDVSRHGPRAVVAKEWHAHLATLKPDAPADEQAALTAARLFTEYLKACRQERYAMSLLPPGRFLLPGSLAGSPALTFAPLDVTSDNAPLGSLHAMMRRRYESYKDVVVRPFFREHFARLDRQIVLVDALAALNAGPEAVHDLEASLAAILDCFRTGRRTLLGAMFNPHIDRIVFAATKADHLHHSSHDRLEAILKRMVQHAATRAELAGAGIDAIALAAVRATREARVRRGNEELPSIIGTPIAGERANGEVFDGKTEVATFPGDLPEDPESLFSSGGAFRGLTATTPDQADFRFLRFRPPVMKADEPMPHIRLDRALETLFGDRLQ